MKLVAIQHCLLGSAAKDFETLAESVSVACALGAETIVCPRVESIQDGSLIARPFLDRVGQCADGTALLVPFGWPRDPEAVCTLRPTPLGMTALLTGDEALDPALRDALYATAPDAIVIRPASESALQAEAFIELAIGLSETASAVVIVSEPVGPQSEPTAFGGSCIAVLGELVAEAESETETELLEVEINAPLVIGHTRPPLPEVPRILVQRWAHHNGLKQPVDYPAELS